MLAIAVPAFASARDNDNANCVGTAASGLNEFGQENGVHGLGGPTFKRVTQEESGLGERASTDCH
jgi:hypothetical protein